MGMMMELHDAVEYQTIRGFAGVSKTEGTLSPESPRSGELSDE